MLLEHLQETKKEYKNRKKQKCRFTIYLSKRTRTFFPHDMAYLDFKDLTHNEGKSVVIE